MRRLAALLFAASLALVGCATDQASQDNEQSDVANHNNSAATTNSVDDTEPVRTSDDAQSVTSSAQTSEPDLLPNVKPYIGHRKPDTDMSNPTDLNQQSNSSGSNRTGCGNANGDQAVRQNIANVQPERWDWDPGSADTTTYDACKPLSWVVVTIHHGTASSPFQIMLFHYGEYLGTTTAEAYGFWPTVTRANDHKIDVTYHYQKPGEGVANSSGETYASFAWDESAGRVVMSGSVPPT